MINWITIRGGGTQVRIVEDLWGTPQVAAIGQFDPTVTNSLRAIGFSADSLGAMVMPFDLRNPRQLAEIVDRLRNVIPHAVPFSTAVDTIYPNLAARSKAKQLSILDEAFYAHFGDTQAAAVVAADPVAEPQESRRDRERGVRETPGDAVSGAAPGGDGNPGGAQPSDRTGESTPAGADAADSRVPGAGEGGEPVPGPRDVRPTPDPHSEPVEVDAEEVAEDLLDSTAVPAKDLFIADRALIAPVVTLEAKRLRDHETMVLLTSVLKERIAAGNEGRAPVFKLSPEDKARLLAFSGTVFGQDGDRLYSLPPEQVLGYIDAYVKTAARWRRASIEDVGPEEASAYGVSAMADKGTDAAKTGEIARYQHYLSKYEVTEAASRVLWDIALRAGFDGGKVFIGNSGTGMLSATRPETEKAIVVTQLPGEPAAFEIARTILPEDSVIGGLYEKVLLPSGYFDLVMGLTNADPVRCAQRNETFVKDEVLLADPDTPPLNDAEHLIFKSMMQLRPGGLGIYLVPTVMFSHDKTGRGAAARARIFQHGEPKVLARAPSAVFRGMSTADPQAIANNHSAASPLMDLIVLGRREQNLSLAEAQELDKQLQLTDAKPTIFEPKIPEMTGKVTTTVAQIAAVEAAFGDEMNRALADFRDSVLSTITPDDYRPREAAVQVAQSAALVLAEQNDEPATRPLPDGSYVLINDGLDVGVLNQGVVTPFDGLPRRIDILKSMIPVRDAIRATIDIQVRSDDDDLLRAEQARLGAAYASFVSRFGPLSSAANVEAFHSEPGLPTLLALEHYDPDANTASQTDFFTERVTGRPRLITRAETPDQALAISLGRVGYVDPGLISSLLAKPWDKVARDLKGKIFLDPLEGRWVTAPMYLSGHVRGKLESARVAAAIDPIFEPNVKALEDVQPKPVSAADISFQLGAPWISPLDVRRFVLETLGLPFKTSPKSLAIQYDRNAARWSITFGKDLALPEAASLRWATESRDVKDIYLSTLNNQSVRVMVKTKVEIDGGFKEVEILDHEQTARCQMLQERLKDEFYAWCFKNPHRLNRLARVYNERVNVHRERVYTGDYLTFDNMSPLQAPEPHQRSAVARGIEDGSMLVAHAVGSGKSFVVIASAMEWRRMGLAKKPMVTVPKTAMNGFAAEILKFYPTARVLFIDGLSNRRPEEVRKMVSRARMGDWDIILISHDSFGAIPLSAKAKLQLLRRERMELAKDKLVSNDEALSLRERSLDRRVEALTEEIRAEEASGADQFGFETIGVDLLESDEHHLFKNVPVHTKMTVLGIPTSGSDRAIDMDMKLSWVQLNNNDRGVITSTATPICNSVAELYTMMSFVNKRVLRSVGIRHFDAWAATFGRSQALIEQKPAGNGWQIRERFISFQNVPEMCRLFRMLADVRQDDDIPDIAARRPKLRTILNISPKDATDLALLKSLDVRSKAIEARTKTDTSGGLWKKDSVIVIMGDLHRAMLDPRILDPDIPENDQSIASLTAARVWELYQRYDDRSGTQLLFIDNGINGRFSLYQDIKQKLIALGIPANEIAFIQDAATPAERRRLENRVNAGRVRVVIGSSNRMGIALNVQRKIVGMHHVDTPLRPDMVKQRIGRGHRPGNENMDVGVENHVYAKAGNTRRFEILMHKAAAFDMAMRNPDNGPRVIEEELSYTMEEVQAALTDNPLIRQKVAVDAEFRTLDLSRRAHLAEIARVQEKHDLLEKQLQARHASAGYFTELVNSTARLLADWAEEAATRADRGGQLQVQIDQFELQAQEMRAAEREAFDAETARLKKEAKEAAKEAASPVDAALDLLPPEAAEVKIGSPTVDEKPAEGRPKLEVRRAGEDPLNPGMPAGADELKERVKDRVFVPSKDLLQLRDQITALKEERNNLLSTGYFDIEIEGTRYHTTSSLGEAIYNACSNFPVFAAEAGMVGKVGPLRLFFSPNKLESRGNSLFEKGGSDLGTLKIVHQDWLGQSQSVFLDRGVSVSVANTRSYANGLRLYREVQNMSAYAERRKAELAEETSRVAAMKEFLQRPFEGEERWKTLMSEKAEIDAAMLSQQIIESPEQISAIMEPIRGTRLASGRPLHPEELKEWKEDAADAVVAVVAAEADPSETQLAA